MLTKKTLVVLSTVLLGACATPKYSYHFGKHNYQAGAVTIENKTVEESRSTNEDEITTSPIHDAPVAYASIDAEKMKAVVANLDTKHAYTKTEQNMISKSASFNTKADLKQAKAELKKATASFKAIKKADGVNATKGFARNQLVALLFALFFGALGIHRFYLGKIGSGIVFFVLAMTSFLIVPGIALLIWLLIDIIRIIMGRLKPKGADYETTF
jgi:TM2 domain-containing membrane protein YozV